jgi:hypothetical protein
VITFLNEKALEMGDKYFGALSIKCGGVQFSCSNWNITINVSGGFRF